MVYLSLILISGVLAFLELSFFPYFKIFNTGAFLVLPFLVILAVRYKGYVHILVALVLGLVFDFASAGTFGIFAAIYLLTVLIGRLFFFRDTSYETNRAFLSLLLISTLAVYLSQSYVLFSLNFVGWQNYLIITGVGLLLTLISGLILYKVSFRYIDWLNKKSDERNK